jgi:hypothetical protein
MAGSGQAAATGGPRKRSIRRKITANRVGRTVRDRRCLHPVHEGVVPAGMQTPSLGDLALGDEPELGVGEGVEGHPAHPQQPRAQAAFDFEAQRAFGACHSALALDPQLPIVAAQVPRAMLDPRRGPHALKVQARVRDMYRGVNLEHLSSIVTKAMKVICSHNYMGRTRIVALNRFAVLEGNYSAKNWRTGPSCFPPSVAALGGPETQRCAGASTRTFGAVVPVAAWLNSPPRAAGTPAA